MNEWFDSQKKPSSDFRKVLQEYIDKPKPRLKTLTEKEQQDILSVPNLFQSNPDLFNIASSKLIEIDSELNLAEQKWLELEIKRETLELNLS